MFPQVFLYYSFHTSDSFRLQIQIGVVERTVVRRELKRFRSTEGRTVQQLQSRLMGKMVNQPEAWICATTKVRVVIVAKSRTYSEIVSDRELILPIKRPYCGAS